MPINLSPVYAYSFPYAGFTKKDIDSDGFDELLIGDQFEDGSEEYSPGHCYLTIYKPLPGQGEAKLTSIEKMK